MSALEALAKLTAEPQAALTALGQIQADAPFTTVDASQLPRLLKVLGNSNFLRRWACRHPETVARMLSASYQSPLTLEQFNEDLKAAPQAATAEDLARILTEFKYRHLFRITLLDLNDLEPLETILGQLSALAASIMAFSLDYFERQSAEKTKIPFTILAMGKLGGNELNFSSDLDLIYIHGNQRHPEKTLPNGETVHQHFVRLSQTLTNFLNRKTADGFLYRIDLELRPQGKDGALVNSLEAMEQYYEFFGAPWEKQALIKTGLAAGNADLWRQFLKGVEPFVFSKISDFSLLQNLKEMKAKILASLKSQEKNRLHLKLGDGGIREIEFFIQSMQLLFGGMNPGLRSRNSLQAILDLKAAALIRSDEADRLAAAYRYLRKMEHRLQLVEEQQTHLLPTSDEELAQLARRMGYAQPDPAEAAAAMRRDLEMHRDFVKATFQELLSHRFEE